MTSSGTIYGNTQLTFTDVLGDKQIGFYAQSVAQYRTTAFTYVNIERRLQYALQGFSQDCSTTARTTGGALRPDARAVHHRDLAESVQTQRGGTVFGIYPFNRYSRVELFGGYMHLTEHYTNQPCSSSPSSTSSEQYGHALFRNGNMMPFGVSFVQRDDGLPRIRAGGRQHAASCRYDGSPALGDSWISRNTLDVDARHYLRLGGQRRARRCGSRA